ncbi:MAG: UDP-N-acetylmuramyl-tripeptide synthetase [Patescibacteria group bacterium]
MIKKLVRSLVPAPLLDAYHKSWALGGAAWYRNPSRQLVLIGVTGTKGKSTTTELIATLLRAAGHQVAVASTIHFVIGEHVEPNLFKMTMPGRAYVQKFLRRAVDAGCTHAVVEMTSEAAKQYRHLGIELNGLVFTNLQPEHLESHGSMEAYAAAKLELAHALERNPKRPRIIVANTDDTYGQKFLDIDADIKAPFSLKDASAYTADETQVRFVWREMLFTVPLPGLFNLYNCLAALTLGEALGLSRETMHKALEHIKPIAGRQERIEMGQPFAVVIDYAHTPDSLRALYETYKHSRIIGVLGSMGGGRDAWKHPEMGRLADEYCGVAILTEEDPYDDDPAVLIANTKKGFVRHTPRIEPKRRDAIRAALKEARQGDVVLITGKGTDPYIMGPHGSKEPWSEYKVAVEELQKLGYTG